MPAIAWSCPDHPLDRVVHPVAGNSIRAGCVVVSLCFDGEVAAGRIALADGRGRLGLVGLGPGQLPAGRLRAPGQRPGGLAGGAVGDVLGRRRGPPPGGRARPGRSGAAPPSGRRRRPAAPARPRRPAATSASRPSASPHSSPRRPPGPGGPGWCWPAAARAARRWRGAVGGAFALQVGDQGEPVGPGGALRASADSCVVVDPEQRGGGVEHPGGVEGADQRQEPARWRRRTRPRCRRGRRPGRSETANTVPDVPTETTTSPGRAPSPRAAAMLSPVPARARPPRRRAPGRPPGRARAGAGRRGRGRARAGRGGSARWPGDQ